MPIFAKRSSMRFSVLLFLAAGLALACAGPCAADDLTPLDIFAKHAAAVGYSLSSGAKPYVREMKVASNADGIARTWTYVLKQAGAFYRVDYTENGRRSAEGFDGHGFWHSDINGNIEYDIGDARPYDVTAGVLQAEGFDATLAPEMRNPTEQDYVVRVHPKSGATADVYFNKTTFLEDREVIAPENGGGGETFKQYERQGPVMLATQRESGETVYTMTKFQWDAPLTADDFSAPPRRSFMTFPQSGKTTVSFDDDKDSGIIIEATVNGIKGRFLLDTGAGGTYFGTAFASRAGLTPLDATSTIGIGGASKDHYAKIASLQIGDSNVKDFYGIITGAKLVGFDGLFGYDVLSQAVCAIDFDKHTVTFADPAMFREPSDVGAVVIGLDDGSPQIQATLDQKAQVFMDIDTGDDTSMTFTRAFVDKNPGIVAKSYDMTSVGVGGFESGYLGSLSELDFGPFKFYGLEADVLLGFRGFSANKDVQGLVGYQLLKRFNMTFDYAANRMYLALNKYGHDTQFK